jgi:PAS domain S-box-containing protein
VTGCSLIGRDITLQVRSQQNTAQANENLKLAATAARMGIWTYSDKKFNFDARCLQLFGLDPKTFDGSFRSFLHCVSERDRQRVYIKSQGNLESDEEFEVIWPDGSAHDVLAKGREYMDGNGVRTWAGICMDVTERRQAQRETALLKLLQQREEFMATLAHDLKNPLIAVRRLLEMLIAGRMGTMTEEQTNLMVQIMETNSGLLSLIKNLLDIYREEQHALGHSREQTDVRKLVDECVTQFEPIAQMRSVQIHKQVPNEPVPMIADSDGIRRILQNLLDNAVKFSAVDGEVKVKLVHSPHDVIIEIEDDGKGVPPSEQQRLFQRFSQGSEGRKYTDGSGLGLYLCRRLVEAHGGRIDYVGRLNEGAKFRVCLPIALRRTLSGEFKSFR